MTSQWYCSARDRAVVEETRRGFITLGDLVDCIRQFVGVCNAWQIVDVDTDRRTEECLITLVIGRSE